MNFNDPLHPNDLGVILSYQCTAECAHCLYNSGPGWTDWMDAQAVREALQVAREAWGPTFQVHMTGGEAFLNLPLLCQAVKAAADLGLPVYVETSAAWCVDDAVAEKQYRMLKDAGLQAVLVSCSPFHAERIPLLHTLNAIEAGVNVFGPTRVMVYLPEWMERVAAFGVEEPVPLAAYIERYGIKRAGRLFWEDYRLIAGGRSGYRLGHLAMRFPAETFEGEACRYEMLYAPHSHFDLYGNYIPSFCAGISLGNWRALAQLREAFAGGHLPALIDRLVKGGPYGLYQFAARAVGYEQLADGYAGKCHLCADVRKHLFAAGGYPELQPAGFYERLA